MRLTITCLLLAIGLTLNAQRAIVYYDFAKNTFGNFEDLPAEEDLLINGALPPGAELVEIQLFADEVDEDDVLYTGFWTANGTSGAREFSVPMNYALRPGNSYTFLLSFYHPVNAEGRQELYAQIRKNLEAYLNLNYEIDEDELELKQRPRKLRRELDQIVHQGLRQYRVTSPGSFPGFSDIILKQLDALDNSPVNTAGSKPDGLQSLMSLIDSELRSLLNQDIAMLRTQRQISDYPVEDKPGYFSIIAGYGAVYYDGDLDNLDYGDGAFVGLGFPLASSKVAPKIFRNAELSLGVFTNNLDIDGREFTGPIVNRPIFLGLDYKLFSFVRLNAGATFLEEDNGNEGMFENLDTRVRVRPFVGLSAKINLSISLDK
jgi:hypothetical protein